jgi:transcription elongation factor Elf1
METNVAICPAVPHCCLPQDAQSGVIANKTCTLRIECPFQNSVHLFTIASASTKTYCEHRVTVEASQKEAEIIFLGLQPTKNQEDKNAKEKALNVK